MSDSNMTVSMATFKARLQGAGQDNGSAILAVAAHRRSLANNHHNSCVRDAVVERVTRMHGQILHIRENNWDDAFSYHTPQELQCEQECSHTE